MLSAVHRVQFSFLSQSSCAGVGCILPYRQAHSFRAFAPFQVIRAFLVPFFLAVHEHNVGFHTSIGGQQNAAIPPSVRRLDSLCEIDFAIGHAAILPDSGISVGITDSQVLDNKSNGGEGGIRSHCPY
jgi:hypothetical protein